MHLKGKKDAYGEQMYLVLILAPVWVNLASSLNRI